MAYQEIPPSGGSAVVVANDWREFANYMCSALMPALHNTPVFTDYLWFPGATTDGLDWTATLNAPFPGANAGGQIIMSTVSLVLNQGFLGVRTESPIDYFPSLGGAPWFVAGRGRGALVGGVANLNSKRAIASIIRLGNANSCNFGYNVLVSPNLCIWADQGNADIGISAASTVAFEDLRTYELYGWFDGCSVRMMYGDWDAGVDPTLIAEMVDTSKLPDQIGHPGCWIKSTDGVRTDMTMDATFGRTRQPS